MPNVEDEDLKMLKGMGVGNDAISEKMRRQKKKPAPQPVEDDRSWFQRVFGSNKSK